MHARAGLLDASDFQQFRQNFRTGCDQSEDNSLGSGVRRMDERTSASGYLPQCAGGDNHNLHRISPLIQKFLDNLNRLTDPIL